MLFTVCISQTLCLSWSFSRVLTRGIVRILKSRFSPDNSGVDLREGLNEPWPFLKPIERGQSIFWSPPSDINLFSQEETKLFSLLSTSGYIMLQYISTVPSIWIISITIWPLLVPVTSIMTHAVLSKLVGLRSDSFFFEGGKLIRKNWC